MHYSDFWREEAARYRSLAEGANDDSARAEFSELADVCEAYANQIDDMRASG